MYSFIPASHSSTKIDHSYCILLTLSCVFILRILKLMIKLKASTVCNVYEQKVTGKLTKARTRTHTHTANWLQLLPHSLWAMWLPVREMYLGIYLSKSHLNAFHFGHSAAAAAGPNGKQAECKSPRPVELPALSGVSKGPLEYKDSLVAVKVKFD